MAQDKKREGDTGGQKGPFSAPAISLPKGGGAIRGIGEKLAVNPVTGTGSMTIPIVVSPGRSGFGPQLALSYDSGSGNGPFGFGWSLGLPAISRKTDKGLPRYRDAEESDVYILSGAEDLVPVLEETAPGIWRAPPPPPPRDDYTVTRYRPRIEGLFARIERWTRPSDGDTFWRSISKDNVTTVYGRTIAERIADPADPERRIFSWLISESFDDKGNVIRYEYATENGADVETKQAHERNRTAEGRAVQRYLKSIKYGNTPSRLIQPDPAAMRWRFEVIFDYGEGRIEELPEDAERRQFVRAWLNPPPGHAWPIRKDPFSTYRAGFEVRTYRLCRRILMFHHFPAELGADDTLVRSTDLTYAERPIGSFLTSVTQCGYVRPANRPEDPYLRRSLPPLELTYSAATVQSEVREVDAESLENLPVGIDGSTYRFVDLDGEGVPGILTEQAGAWFYKRNLSPAPSDGRPEARFAPVELVAHTPASPGLGGGLQLMDLAGDGRIDLVQLAPPLAGFFERTPEGGWDRFVPFMSLPNAAWSDPNLKFIDLTGDGHADLLIAGDDVFTWYPSLAEEGFGPSEAVRQALEEEQGPRLVFADGTHSIHLADLSGDGLTDLVRIRNGEVCYWPNLGYGRFGAKVTMDGAPWFDPPDQFDPRRIRLADVDGSGVTDILYLGRDGVRLYFNRSGNSWSPAETLPAFPAVDNLADIEVLDLLGQGTACLVWSSPLPGAARRPMRYVDLMGGRKPHLLVKIINNLGAETELDYAPSTRFYLDDLRNGRPWITRLAFPVHVVERVVTRDRVSGNRFVTRYAYHHGYFDGEEREFRGFGMVEQWDTEEFDAFRQGEAEATNLDEASHVPPVRTRTWFHTGAYLGRNHVSDFFAGLLDANDIGEYYREPGLSDAQARALLLDDTVLPEDLTVDEEREACRALKGSMLRQEVYAQDGTDEADHPYTVTEQNFTIRTLQQRGGNRHAVFFSHAREAISYHYERKPADPRIQHALTLEVDEYGNVLKSAAIGYGRREPVPDPNLSVWVQAEQTKIQAKILITYTENGVTNAVDTADDHRAPLPCESRTCEQTGVIEWQNDYPEALERYFRPRDRERFTFEEVLAAGTTAIALDYEKAPTSGRLEKRLIEHVRTYYRRDDLSGALPLGELQSLALPFESYKLAFTPGLVAEVFGGRVSDDMLDGNGATPGGRYVHPEGDANWWIPSGQIFYSPNAADTPAQELAYARRHYFLPHRYRDPFHTDAVSTESFVTYDTYDLLVEETRDALDNRVTVGERNLDPTQPLVLRAQDYRVLQPALIMDPNRNCSEVRFDALGMVVGTAVMGKPEESPRPGDRFTESFLVDLTQHDIDQFLANPKGLIAATLLDEATTRVVYDLTAYWREPDPAKKPPPVAATLARETHLSDLQGRQTKIQATVSYSDGFGREIQKKIQAEPGSVPARDAAGKIIVGADGQPVMTSYDVSPRWVGGGWTVFNNKGKPVRQYESFFTDTHGFEFDVRIGVSPVLFYDPVQRVVATLHPNHSWEKVVFDPWRQETWDVNDTVLIADPKTDADVGDFFGRLCNAEYLPTWHALRTNAAYAAAFALRYPDATNRTNETRAANKTRVHAATPTVVHADSLGRTFLTVAHNKFKYGEAPPAAPPIEEFHATRLVLDIEGNQREIIDAKDRVVMRYAYSVAGPEQDENGKPTHSNRIHQASMDAGERWTLNDVAGKPIRAWDSRGFVRRMAYDQLRRIRGLHVTEKGVERLAEQTVYGESVGDASNLRTRVYKVFDGAGVVTSVAYDFKGNLLESRRDLLPNYTHAVDWLENPTPDDGSFTSRTTYDALNRHVTVVSPDASVYRPTFNEANLLDKVDVNLRGEQENGAPAWTPVVVNIDYNAKGQRQLIVYGNGAQTAYEYDPLTFRLTKLTTTRATGSDGAASQIYSDPAVVQDLRYTYNPASNITRIEDAALRTIHHDGEKVEPVCDYTYDAIDRLIEVKGREHIGQSGFQFNPPDANRRDYPFVGMAHPSDLQALRNYTERYEYDAVGNFEYMRHVASGGRWTREYAYDADSLIEPDKKSNRLTTTKLGDGSHTETYSYGDDEGTDVHGCMTAINSMSMVWDFEDQLQQVGLGGGGTAYYVYDAAGQRVRKVIETQNGTRQHERIYLGGFEVFRQQSGDRAGLVRESLHIRDDKQRIALVETRTQEEESDVPEQLIRYQFGNHLGSASVELDRDGALISYEEYYPHGTTAFQAGRSAAEVSLKRYRYTGKERDEETGFSYHGARYYAPWIGSWISCDPDEMVDSLSSYTYVRGNPIKLHDANGRQATPREFVRLPPMIGITHAEWARIYETKFKEKTATSRETYRAWIASSGEPPTSMGPQSGAEVDVRRANESERKKRQGAAFTGLGTIIEAPIQAAAMVPLVNLVSFVGLWFAARHPKFTEVVTVSVGALSNAPTPRGKGELGTLSSAPSAAQQSPQSLAGRANEKMFEIAMKKVRIPHVSQSALKDSRGKTIYTKGSRGGHRIIDTALINMFNTATPLELKLPLTLGGGRATAGQLRVEDVIYGRGLVLTLGTKRTSLYHVVERPTLVSGWATIFPPTGRQ